MLLVEEGGEGVTDSGRKRNWVERRKGKVDQRLVFEGSLMPPLSADKPTSTQQAIPNTDTGTSGTP